ncbi:MAG: methylated-DNA--[protein]-cysteine S-methyltransferase [Bacteroidota bacterium]
METAFIQTPLGVARLQGDSNGLASISIMENSAPLTDIIPDALEDAVYQLREYFEGSRQSFSLSLNPQGTDFQQKVWHALAEIPFGKTVSYLQLSKRLGDAKAIRAVAAANGKNPLWVVVPCHRVIGSDGSLVGYAGGLHRKKWLLNHERPVKQQSLF